MKALNELEKRMVELLEKIGKENREPTPEEMQELFELSDKMDEEKKLEST